MHILKWYTLIVYVVVATNSTHTKVVHTNSIHGSGHKQYTWVPLKILQSQKTLYHYSWTRGSTSTGLQEIMSWGTFPDGPHLQMSSPFYMI